MVKNTKKHFQLVFSSIVKSRNLNHALLEELKIEKKLVERQFINL